MKTLATFYLFFYSFFVLGIEPCAVGSTVEVLINPHHAARPELLEVSLMEKLFFFFQTAAAPAVSKSYFK